MFKTLTVATAFATALFVAAPGAYASGSSKLSSETREAIHTKLAEQGYEVRKIKTEDGLYEAYVIKDGVRQELYLNSELKIVKSETDD